MDEGALPQAEPPVVPVVVLFAPEDDPDPEDGKLELFDEPCEDPENEVLVPPLDELEGDPEAAEPEPVPEVMFWVELLAG